MKLSDVANLSGVVFGTSGVRGLVLAMTPDVCGAYTQAFLKSVAINDDVVVLGQDLRPSSQSIVTSCAKAILDAGKKVLFVGEQPTPAVAYIAAIRKAPAIIVTGSHIPFDRNGIKFYRADGEITKDDEAVMLNTQLLVRDTSSSISPPPVNAMAGDAYIRRYIDAFGAGCLAGKRIALYEHSSVARDVLRTLLSALEADVISLGRTDTFVPIDTEAVRPEDVAQAKVWASTHCFDAILSTDGDADRPLIGDETGTWLRGDVVGVLCAQALSADVVVTPVSSNTAAEKCGAFKKVVRTRIGSPYVIAEMQAAAKEYPTGTVVAGYEANGGFLLGTDVQIGGRTLKALPTRDSVLPMLALLTTAAKRGVPLSELPKSLPRRFTASDRIQDVPTAVSRAWLKELGNDTEKAAELMAPDAGVVTHMDLTDGLRLTFASGDVVHLRPSGNAPELRCYTESSDPKLAASLCECCLRRMATLGKFDS
jgi:phosphomannomutase